MKKLSLLLLMLLALSMFRSIELEQTDESSSDFTQEQLQEMKETGEQHEFQAEVGRLMDIIINSLYSQKEVFLRELISNSADALDKIRFQSVQDESVLGEDKDLQISVEYEKDKKTISVQDNGIGMTKQDLMQNLGTVAKSGTTQFIEAIKGGNLNLIGQFGVGFYASFLAASKVQVISKHNDDDQYIWESSAANEFTIIKDPRGNTLKRGTKVVLHLKEEATELCDEFVLKDNIKRYSEFINFPIRLRVQRETSKEVPIEEEEEEKKDDDEEKKDDDEEKKDDDIEVKDEDDKKEEKPKTKTVTEKYWDYEIQNENKAIWTRSAEDIEEEEYNKFYKQFTKDSSDPMSYTHFKTDGGVEFRSILYVPKTSSDSMYDNYYSSKSNNIKLYVRRVLISDSFDELMPKYLNFIKGVVDSDDLPLNVNREQLQQTKMIKQISRKLVKKSLEMINNIMKGDDDEDKDDDEEKEEKEEKDKKEIKDNQKFMDFYKEFAKNIKMGIIEDQANKAKLAKYLRFSTTKDYVMDKEGDKISLDKYIARMKEGQDQIYYIAGESLKDIYRSPHIQGIIKRDYEVLMMDDPLDEFVIQHLDTYNDKRLINVSKGNFKLPEDEASKKKQKKIKKMYKPLLEYWEKMFPEDIQSVGISQRLVDEPLVILSSEYGSSANMERIQKAQTLGRQNQQNVMFAGMNKKILELNPGHPLIKELLEKVRETKAQDEDGQLNEDLKDMIHILTNGALINSGYQVKDTQDFNQRLGRQLYNLAGIPKDTPVEEIEVDMDEDDEEVAASSESATQSTENAETVDAQVNVDDNTVKLDETNTDEKDDL